ncbi:hypothetical protein MRX96_055166 [Rhipicephalus microplus]
MVENGLCCGYAPVSNPSIISDELRSQRRPRMPGRRRPAPTTTVTPAARPAGGQREDRDDARKTMHEGGWGGKGSGGWNIYVVVRRAGTATFGLRSQQRTEGKCKGARGRFTQLSPNRIDWRKSESKGRKNRLSERSPTGERTAPGVWG